MRTSLDYQATATPFIDVAMETVGASFPVSGGRFNSHRCPVPRRDNSLATVMNGLSNNFRRMRAGRMSDLAEAQHRFKLLGKHLGQRQLSNKVFNDLAVPDGQVAHCGCKI